MRAFSKTLAAVLLCGVASLAQAADTAICYNCPPDWADWGTQLKAIAASTGVQVPLDNKNSGQSLAQLVAEKAAPVADVVYYGVTFGLQAQKAGVVEGYKPKGWEHDPRRVERPCRPVVCDPLRHPGHHGQRRCIGRPAGAAKLGRPAQAAI